MEEEEDYLANERKIENSNKVKESKLLEFFEKWMRENPTVDISFEDWKNFFRKVI